MRKLIKIIFFTLLICLNIGVFADNTINIALDKNDVSVNDSFIVIIDIESNYTGSIEISEIKGIEQFTKKGQENSKQYININGEELSKIKLKLTLLSSNIGDFIIGPAQIKIGEEIIESNSVEIHIKKEEKTILNTQNTQNINNIDKKADKKNEDIKGIKNSGSIFHEFMYYQVFIILLLILLYLYNSRINKKNEIVKSSEMSKIKIFNEKQKILIKNLKKLLKSVEMLNKTEFYEKLNKFFREYFDLIGAENTDIMTLKEIKNLNLDSSLISLFEESYFNEFNHEKDTILGRKNLINKFIKFIK